MPVDIPIDIMARVAIVEVKGIPDEKFFNRKGMDKRDTINDPIANIWSSTKMSLAISVFFIP